jgi:hypothetical protein
MKAEPLPKPPIPVPLDSELEGLTSIPKRANRESKSAGMGKPF